MRERHVCDEEERREVMAQDYRNPWALLKEL